MAKIYLNIEAESPEDYHATLRGLVGTGLPPVEEPVQETVEPGEPRRRGRPPRSAQAADQTDNRAAAASSVSGAGTAMEAGTAGTGATTSVDPFADQIKEAVAQAGEPEVTLEQVKAAGAAYMEKTSAQKVSELLEKTAGVKRFAELKPEHFKAVYDALQAALQ